MVIKKNFEVSGIICAIAILSMPILIMFTVKTSFDTHVNFISTGKECDVIFKNLL